MSARGLLGANMDQCLLRSAPLFNLKKTRFIFSQCLQQPTYIYASPSIDAYLHRSSSTSLLLLMLPTLRLGPSFSSWPTAPQTHFIVAGFLICSAIVHAVHRRQSCPPSPSPPIMPTVSLSSSSQTSIAIGKNIFPEIRCYLLGFVVLARNQMLLILKSH